MHLIMHKVTILYFSHLKVSEQLNKLFGLSLHKLF